MELRNCASVMAVMVKHSEENAALPDARVVYSKDLTPIEAVFTADEIESLRARAAELDKSPVIVVPTGTHGKCPDGTGQHLSETCFYCRSLLSYDQLGHPDELKQYIADEKTKSPRPHRPRSSSITSLYMPVIYYSESVVLPEINKGAKKTGNQKTDDKSAASDLKIAAQSNDIEKPSAPLPPHLRLAKTRASTPNTTKPFAQSNNIEKTFDRKAVKKDLLKVAKENFAGHQVTQRDHTLDGYKPTDDEVLREYHRVIHTHHLFYKDGVNWENRELFRQYLMYHNHWEISDRRVKGLLLKRQVLVPFGLIPTTKAAKEEYANKVSQHGLGKAKAWVASSKSKDKEAKEAAKDHKAHGKLVRQRAARPTQWNEVYELVASTTEQNESVLVSATFRIDHNFKSSLDYHIHFNYKDDKEKEQPVYHVRVYITYRNARKRDSSNEPGDFKDDHRCTIIKDSSIIVNLFGNMTDQLAGELETSARQAKQDIAILSFPHNEYAFASKLFVPDDSVMPEGARRLAKVLREAEAVYTMVRARNMPKLAANLFERFKEDDVFDPLTVQFKSTDDMKVHPNTLAPNPRRFVTDAKFVFETYIEWSRVTGIAALREAMFAAKKCEYEGEAAVNPIDTSYVKEISLHRCYTLMVSIKKSNKPRPTLQEGTNVSVSFSRTENDKGTWWKGKVTASVTGTGLDQVTIVVDRPYDKPKAIKRDGRTYWSAVPLDTSNPSDLKYGEMARMDSSSLRHYNKQHRRPILIITGDIKEQKRIASNIASLDMPYKQQSERKAQWEKLQQFQQLFMGVELDRLQRTSLYEDVEEKEQILAFARAKLRDYQMKPVEAWMDKGLLAGLGMVHGPSGSGKSFLVYIAIMGYMGTQVFYPLSEWTAMHDLGEAYEKQRQEKREEAKAKDETSDDGDRKEAPMPEADAPFIEGDIAMIEGRVTLVAVQNATADRMFEAFSTLAKEFDKALGRRTSMGVRLHSLQTEVTAVIAMTKSTFNADEFPPLPNNIINPEHLDDLTAHHTNNYIGAKTGGYADITDKRFKLLEGSAAYLIMMFAGLYPKSEAITSKFTPEELEQIEEALADIPDARADIIVNDNRLSRDIINRIKFAAKKGLDFIIQRADWIVTTVAVATKYSFNTIRKTTAVACEETGRMTDAEFAGLFGHYCFAKARIATGSPYQLAPIPFAPETENGFAQQIKLSSMARLLAVGFPVYELQYTTRFRTQMLLEICNIVNRREFQPVQGAIKGDVTKESSKLLNHVWNIYKPVVLINVEQANSAQTSVGSWYSLDCAFVAMHALKAMIERNVPAERITYISPYTAQVNLMANIIRAAQSEARLARRDQLAHKLDEVILSTVDAYMGQDNDHVIVDLGARDGFVFSEDRFLVAHTRGRSSMQIIADTGVYTGPNTRFAKRQGHPWFRMFRYLLSQQAVKNMADRTNIKNYPNVAACC